jgi:hypothetical protein
MFSTLVLYFLTCNNLVNNGNQQEKLVDSNNFNSKPKFFYGALEEVLAIIQDKEKMHTLLNN